MGGCPSSCNSNVRLASIDDIAIISENRVSNNSNFLNTSFENLAIKQENNNNTEFLATNYQKCTDFQDCDIFDDPSPSELAYISTSEQPGMIKNFKIRNNRFIEDKELMVKLIIWQHQIEEKKRSDSISCKSLLMIKQEPTTNLNNNLQEQIQPIQTEDLCESLTLDAKLSRKIQQLNELNQKPKVNNIQTGSKNIVSESRFSVLNSSQNSTMTIQNVTDIFSRSNKNQNQSTTSCGGRRKGILKYKIIQGQRSRSSTRYQHPAMQQQSIYINGRKKKVSFTPETNFNFQRITDSLRFRRLLQ